ncbi:MAG TPA: NfeD family protein [Solirubrobacterales bacterium]|jgi:membrane-bound serine protease (ClpP class)|nr:NfeD family protein [Solirubrobacterales bacterium]
MTAVIVLLLVLALVLFVAEAHVSSGILGILGIAALVGAGLVYRHEGHRLPVVVIVAVAVLLGVLVLLAGRKVLYAHRNEPVRTGYEEMAGATAEVRSTLDPDGQVFLQGAIWHARLRGGEGRVAVGDRVRVESVDGLTLIVRPDAPTEEGAS